MSAKPTLLSLCCCVLFPASLAVGGVVEDVEELLKLRKFGDAANLLTDGVLTGAEKPDYARYLRATARFRAKQYAESLQDCEAIPEDSDWYRKAIFLKAENLIAQKRHGAAEAIYRSEAGRLFSVARKEGWRGS